MTLVDTADLPEALISFLGAPSSYPHPVASVEHRQTHISHLFFAGAFVYKVKKPVDLGFLDFTTLEKRKEACEAEVRLNRRIAPCVYLGVQEIRRGPGGYTFGPEGEVVEYAVKMRRLPEERRLADAVERGRVDRETLRRLGRLVADFHRRAETSPRIAEFGSARVVAANCEENFEQTRPAIGRTIEAEVWRAIREQVERYLRVHAALFERRVEEGRIRDCHGDILLEDIFVDPETGELHVLDCIEFNERFRFSDTLADAAFVSMDLRYRGRDDLAETLLASYFEASDDERHPTLLAFYECYRAYVRGKVRSFVTDQPGPTAEERARAADEARRYFALAHRLARRMRPRVVLVMGLMGSGKTTLATNLARLAGVRALHTDRVRKALAGVPPEAPARVPFGTGIYAPEWSERTYEAMLDEARRALADARSVVLDGSWSKAKWRSGARAVAAEYQALFAIVECAAAEHVLRRRLSWRAPGAGATDGREELLSPQREIYEAPQAWEADVFLQVETTGDREGLAARVYENVFA
ncbi:MAG: AAA family ATPase [Gemmatimonadetes bacterium]|nr:AAA family ATPase [Gemmatimonadota bacterium]